MRVAFVDETHIQLADVRVHGHVIFSEIRVREAAVPHVEMRAFLERGAGHTIPPINWLRAVFALSRLPTL